MAVAVLFILAIGAYVAALWPQVPWGLGSTDAIVRFDAQRRVVYANPALQRAFALAGLLGAACSGVAPVAKMLMATPLTIWSTLKRMTRKAWKAATNAPLRMPTNNPRYKL